MRCLQNATLQVLCYDVAAKSRQDKLRCFHLVTRFRMVLQYNMPWCARDDDGFLLAFCRHWMFVSVYTL